MVIFEIQTKTYNLLTVVGVCILSTVTCKSEDHIFIIRGLVSVVRGDNSLLNHIIFIILYILSIIQVYYLIFDRF